MKKVITLLTDFGERDPYVASMKGVILNINSGAQIVDISHQVPPRNILEAAYTLYASYRYFPKGTIHIIVVDPGVGSKRKIIALKTKDYIFIAPDNGVLSLVLQRGKIREIVEVTNEKYFLKPVSNTFHGRDIFSPVAAHLSRGVPLGNFGKRINPIRSPRQSRGIRPLRGRITSNGVKKIKELKIAKPEVKKEKLIGKIIHIDHFGNLVTNIDGKILESNVSQRDPFGTSPMSKVRVKIGKKRISGIRRSYVSVKKGELLALFGSSGFLEISVNLGNASRLLGIRIGEKIEVS